MEIKQLEYFRAIVDEGTISGAARTLHMTQPPLSYQMKMLEEELQVQLFIRGSKKIRLTEAGKALYVRAESLLTMTDITKREVIKVSQATTIHLGVTPSTVHMMTKYLVRYTKNHPDIRFVIHDGSTFILKDGLGNGIIDVTTLRTPHSAERILFQTAGTGATACHGLTGTGDPGMPGTDAGRTGRPSSDSLQALQKIYFICI